MAVPNKSKDSATVAGLVLAAIIGYLVFSSSPSGINPPSPTPGPQPAELTLESATVAVIRHQAVGYAAIFRQVANEIGGPITTEAELLTRLATLTKDVREQAKRGFDAQLEIALPFDGEIPPEQFDYVRQVLNGIADTFAKEGR